MSQYDDFDDFDIRHGRESENASSIGLIGFIFAVVSLALLGVVLGLWYIMNQDVEFARNVESKRWMLLWFLFLDMLSFFASLAAIVLGARGLSPANPVYRGYSLSALILGIGEIGITMVLGFFTSCCMVIG